MDKREIIKLKKNNARVYPFYKMFSWDLLFYYAISFVFLVQVKGFNTAQVMLTDALYPIFKIIFSIPSVTIVDKIGKRKSLILANSILGIYLISLMFCNSIGSLILSYSIMAFAFSIKAISESNILYESVSHKNGKGMFSKIEELGIRNYYYLDGITSLGTGFLFVVNGYLPILVSIMFIVIAIALSTCFKEVDIIEEHKTEKMMQRLRDYKEELKMSFKFIFKSHRLQAIMLFTVFFDGLIYSSYTLRESMLTELSIAPQYFALIISGCTIIAGISTALQGKIHKKFRNKSLTFIVSVYVPTFIFIGIISMLKIDWVVKVIIILLLYIVQYVIQSPYYTLSTIYIENFTSKEIRTKISATFGLVKSVSQIAIALFASYLLATTTITNSFIILGIAFLIVMFMVLVYMKPRFGLQPEQYRKEDIETTNNI